MTTLSEKRCLPCEGGIPALDKDSANKRLKQLHKDWSINESNAEIIRDIIGEVVEVLFRWLQMLSLSVKRL